MTAEEAVAVEAKSSRLDEMVQATPESRDRYVDFLRAASILVVVLGHWLMAVIYWDDEGVRGTNALITVPGLTYLTWVLQVMPVFFFVGGFSNAVTLDSLRGKGEGYPEFAGSRARRLMRPTYVFLAVWVPLVLILGVAGVPQDVLGPMGKLAVQLFWFIGIYMIVIAMAPPMLRLHKRFGAKVPAALVAGSVAVDLLRFRVGLPYVGFANFGFVWLLAQQLGFFYAGGSFDRGPRRLAPAMAVTGLTAIALLTTVGSYPRSMVGLPGEEVSNMAPPTVCITALTIWLVGLVMWIRPPVTRWLQRKRPWKATIAVNSVIMTVFLWHLTALLVAVALLYPIGFPQPEAGTTLWWALRPAWIGILTVVLAGLVAVFGRLERPRRERAGGEVQAAAPAAETAGQPATGFAARQAAAVGGIVYLILAITGFAVSGLYPFAGPDGSMLVVFSVSPLQDLGHLAVGAALMAASQRRADNAASAAVGIGLLLVLAGAAGLWLPPVRNAAALNSASDLLHLTSGAALVIAGGAARLSAMRASATPADRTCAPAP